MTREEIYAKMMSGEVSGQSKLGMRSEAIQHKYSAKRLPKLEKKLKKKAKLLVVAEIAVPFNPATGQADDTYNPTTKFRPPYSATTTALYLKKEANENPVCKEAFMKRAGVSEWDTTDLEHLNELDKKIFCKYRVARIFTVPVVSVNIPKMTNRPFGKDYAVYVEHDENGAIIGEVPMILKVNKLFRDICYEKISDFQKQVDDGLVTMTQQQISDRKSKFRQEIAVSDVRPSNWVQIVELPLTNKYEVGADIDMEGITAEALQDLTVISRMTSAIAKCIESYTRGEYEMFDKYFDFFEMDMSCPSTGEDDAKTIGKDTTIDSPKIMMAANPATAKFVPKLEEAFSEYVDSDEDIEQTVRRSTYISNYDDEVAAQVLGTLRTVLDVTDNRFVTKKVIQANSEVIMLAYGDEGAELVEDVDADVSDKSEGALDEAAAEAEGKKQYDLNAETFDTSAAGLPTGSDDLDMDEVDPLASAMAGIN